MPKLTENEPVGIGGAIVALVAAVLPVLVLFGVDLTPEQIAGLQGVVVAVVALVAVLVRRKVTPEAKVVEHVATDSKGHETVVAGPANDKVRSGTIVRDID